MLTTPIEWLADFTANTNLTGVQDEVRTFQLSNGEFWVTWRDLDSGAPADPSGADVLGQRYDPLGNPLGEPIRINQSFLWDAEEDAEFAASIGTDEFSVVYERTDGTGYSELVVERHNAEGVKLNGGGFTNSIAAGAEVRNPDVAIGGATNGLLVWEKSDNAGNTDIMARFFNPTNISYSPIFEVTDIGQSDDNFDPEVVALANGNYAVIWTDEYNGSTTDLDLKGKIYDQAGSVVTSFTIASGLVAETDASIAALAGGGFVVGYTRTDASNNGDVLYRIFDPAGAPLATAVSLATGTDAQGKSSVVATHDGGFVLSWSNEATGETLIQSFTSTGTAVGDPVTIVTGGTAAESVSLTLMGDGRILVGYNVAATGDAQSAIFDPRLEENQTAVYSDGWQVGTVGDDVIVSDIFSPPGAAQIHAMAGNDLVFLSDVVDGGTVAGGQGLDTLSLEPLISATTLDLEAQSITMNARTMTVTGFENVNGSELSDVLAGDASANTLDGRGGDDVLQGRGGDDTLLGGEGNDMLYVNDTDDVVVEAAGAGNDRVLASVNYVLGAGQEIEILSTTNNAGTAAISFWGNELANSIAGNNGSNSLNGGAGADTLNGLGGNDFFYVDNAADVIVEAAGGGFDRVYTSVSYTLGAAAEVEMLRTANDNGTDAINLTGNGFANSIVGNNGANTLNGGVGGDTLDGLGGNDFLYVDNVGDVIVEAAGGGSDRVLASVSYTLGAAAQVEILSTTNNAGTGAINLTGNGFVNNIAGNNGVNVLNGGAGADTLNGLGGDDMFYVDNAADVIVEAAGGGSDRVFASVSYALGAAAQVEILTTANNAGTDSINLAGNGFANSIAGNAGANVLDGLGGNDTLNGLGGADTFRFTTALGAGNVDVITGYSVADDVIQIDDAVFTGLATGAVAAGAFRTGAAAADADDRIIYNSATGALLFDADGNGAGAAVQFATLSAGLAMAAGEFMVI